MDLAHISERFERFGSHECAHVSPLYAALSQAIATDSALLALAATALGRGQPIPNLLFGAVQYLLLTGLEHPLMHFYPALGGAPEPERAFPIFRDFCLRYHAPVTVLLNERLVQTNEVRRCALTMPAISTVFGQQPIALIEVGCSAGLNLLLDQYRYRYGTQQIGAHDAAVMLACEPREPGLPASLSIPQIGWRIGIDLNPVDVRNPDAVRWLQALIWPEQTERALLLRQAIAHAAQSPPPLVAGDALIRLPPILAAIPDQLAVCIVHTFTLNQFSPAMREQWHQLLASESHKRPLHVIGIEWREPMPPITYTHWFTNQSTMTELATCDPHGAWIQWNL